MKKCTDCAFCNTERWSSIEDKERYARCHAPQNIIAVIGDTYTMYRYDYCSVLRRLSTYGAFVTRTCGRNARWFTPKPLSQPELTKENYPDVG